MIEDGAFSHKIDYDIIFRDSKSRRASQLHYWFKSYGNFDDWVNFVYWWSCIGKGSRYSLLKLYFSCSPSVQNTVKNLLHRKKNKKKKIPHTGDT